MGGLGKLRRSGLERGLETPRGTWAFSWLVLGALCLGHHRNSYAILPHPEAPIEQSCSQSLLARAFRQWAWFISPAHPARPEPAITAATSLMMGIPPGVTLDGRDILLYHVRDLFEHEEGFNWIRILWWPLRRRFKVVGNLQNLAQDFGEIARITSIEERRPPEQVSSAVFLRIKIVSTSGKAIVLRFSEQPFFDTFLYVCQDILPASPEDPDDSPEWPEVPSSQIPLTL